MKKSMLRIVSVFIAVLMLFGLVPVLSLGEEAGGDFTIQRGSSLYPETGLNAEEWNGLEAAEITAGRSSSFTEDEIRSADPTAVIRRQNGKVCMITSSAGLATVRSVPEACHTLGRLLPLLGAPEEASLRLWSFLTAADKKIYVFQQVFEGLTVVGSTAKLVTDSEGKVTAVFSSLASALPEGSGAIGITAAEAEEKVRSLGADLCGEVLEGYTCPAVIPAEAADENCNEVLPDRLVWTVCSRNPAFSDSGAELPYLVHFIGTDGEYIRSCAAAVPGAGAVRAGYSAAYTFSFMEKKEWSGTVSDRSGDPVQLSVPVMRDTRTGIWYLADTERQIAVGDFSSLAYGEEEVSLVSCTENGPWDDEDLITYANMIRVWDLYASHGWRGPDGEGTPVLLLRDMCTEDGEPVFNAAYVGACSGWQCFAYGGNCFIGQALDVMAHEFTHCVTGTVMNTNLYRDDMGAVNESLSDIMGNICEAVLEGRADSDWLIGENSGEVFRSMLCPHEFGQPEYVWDIYYVPAVSDPLDINDRGGVHRNSSILNRIAARLVLEEGMSMEKAAELFLTTAFVMTPETDLPALASILRWAVHASGSGRYAPALDKLIAESRMEEKGLPQQLPEEQVLVSLSLPDTEAFRGNPWLLTAVQFDLAGAKERIGAVSDLIGSILSPDTTEEELEGQLSLVSEMLCLDGFDPSSAESAEACVLQILSRLAGKLVKTHMTWQGADSDQISLVLLKQPAFYMLLGGVPGDEGGYGAAILMGDEWFDLGRLFPADGKIESLDPEYAARFIGKAADCLPALFTSSPETAGSVTLSSDGLEAVRIVRFPADEVPGEEAGPAA